MHTMNVHRFHRFHRSRAVALILAITLLSGVSHAGAKFDGSLGGQTDSLSGDMRILTSMGQTFGGNVFFSFATFNIFQGESATFFQDTQGNINNLISRVTGLDPSVLDGPLSSQVDGASVWLINPNGIVFGQGAILDVQGSFHATTADYLDLGTGGRFGADLSDPGDTQLGGADPSAFGFRGPDVAPILSQFNTLEVQPGQSLSLVGGDTTLESSNLTAFGGTINLVSVQSAGTATIQADGSIDTSTFSDFGDLTMLGARADVRNADPASASGSIFIRGGNFVAEGGVLLNYTDQADGGVVDIELAGDMDLVDGSFISTRSFGDGHAPDISIDLQGDLFLQNSVIWSRAEAAGDSGSVSITTPGSVSMIHGDPKGAPTWIATRSLGDGSAGDVHLDIGGDLLVDSFSSGRGAQIFSEIRGDGDGGSIFIDAENVRLINGGTIFAGGPGYGAGGSISITADNEVVVLGESSDVFASRILAETREDNPSGDVSITAQSLVAGDGGHIASYTFGPAQAGDVTINATNFVHLYGQMSFGEVSGLFADARSGGDAGDIIVNTGELNVTDTGRISVLGTDGGSTGEITINADNVNVTTGGTIFAQADNGSQPGSITLNLTGTLTVTSFASIESTGADFSDGGNIDIHATHVVVDQDGTISTGSFGFGENLGGLLQIEAGGTLMILGSGAVVSVGHDESGGGPIVIEVGTLILDTDGTIGTSTFGVGPAGDITITAGEMFLAGGAAIGAETCSCATGPAGAITIDVEGTLSLTGFDTEIRGGSFSPANAGEIRIVAGEILLADQASIQATAVGGGNAGNITLDARTITVESGASIQTSSALSAGGNITLRPTEALYVQGGTISTSANGVSAGDAGGNILVDGSKFIVLNNGVIRANANAGNGGNIQLTTDTALVSSDSVVEASSQTGVDGDILIDAPNQVTGGVLPLAPPDFDTAALVEDVCAAASLRDRSSFTSVGRGGIPWVPGRYAPSPVLEAIWLPALEKSAGSSGSGDDEQGGGR